MGSEIESRFKFDELSSYDKGDIHKHVIKGLIQNGVYYITVGNSVGALSSFSSAATYIYALQKVQNNPKFAENLLKSILGYVESLQEKTKHLAYTGQVSDAGDSKGKKDGDENKEWEAECKNICTEKMKDREGNVLTFADVIGLQKEKETFYSAIVKPLVYPNLYTKSAKGVLLYGPPGTGKTFLVKAAINELAIKYKDTVQVLFFALTGADLKGKYVGETEQRIVRAYTCAARAACLATDYNAKENADACSSVSSAKKLFREIEERNTGRKAKTEELAKKWPQYVSVIFIDEFDSVGKDRNTDETGMAANAVNTLLQMMDGVSSFENVITVAATNYPWNLDAALLRRFNEQLYLNVPNIDDVRKLVRKEMYDRVRLKQGDMRDYCVSEKMTTKGLSPSKELKALTSSIQKKTLQQIRNTWPINIIDQDYVNDLSSVMESCYYEMAENNYSNSDITSVMQKAFNAVAAASIQSGSWMKITDRNPDLGTEETYYISNFTKLVGSENNKYKRAKLELQNCANNYTLYSDTQVADWANFKASVIVKLEDMKKGKDPNIAEDKIFLDKINNDISIINTADCSSKYKVLEDGELIEKVSDTTKLIVPDSLFFDRANIHSIFNAFEEKISNIKDEKVITSLMGPDGKLYTNIRFIADVDPILLFKDESIADMFFNVDEVAELNKVSANMKLSGKKKPAGKHPKEYVMRVMFTRALKVSNEQYLASVETSGIEFLGDLLENTISAIKSYKDEYEKNIQDAMNAAAAAQQPAPGGTNPASQPTPLTVTQVIEQYKTEDPVKSRISLFMSLLQCYFTWHLYDAGASTLSPEDKEVGEILYNYYVNLDKTKNSMEDANNIPFNKDITEIFHFNSCEKQSDDTYKLKENKNEGYDFLDVSISAGAGQYYKYPFSTKQFTINEFIKMMETILKEVKAYNLDSDEKTAKVKAALAPLLQQVTTSNSKNKTESAKNAAYVSKRRAIEDSLKSYSKEDDVRKKDNLYKIYEDLIDKFNKVNEVFFEDNLNKIKSTWVLEKLVYFSKYVVKILTDSEEMEITNYLKFDLENIELRQKLNRGNSTEILTAQTVTPGKSPENTKNEIRMSKKYHNYARDNRFRRFKLIEVLYNVMRRIENNPQVAFEKKPKFTYKVFFFLAEFKPFDATWRLTKAGGQSMSGVSLLRNEADIGGSTLARGTQTVIKEAAVPLGLTVGLGYAGYLAIGAAATAGVGILGGVAIVGAGLAIGTAIATGAPPSIKGMQNAWNGMKGYMSKTAQKVLGGPPSVEKEKEMITNATAYLTEAKTNTAKYLLSRTKYVGICDGINDREFFKINRDEKNKKVGRSAGNIAAAEAQSLVEKLRLDITKDSQLASDTAAADDDEDGPLSPKTGSTGSPSSGSSGPRSPGSSGPPSPGLASAPPSPGLASALQRTGSAPAVLGRTVGGSSRKFTKRSNKARKNITLRKQKGSAVLPGFSPALQYGPDLAVPAAAAAPGMGLGALSIVAAKIIAAGAAAAYLIGGERLTFYMYKRLEDFDDVSIKGTPQDLESAFISNIANKDKGEHWNIGWYKFDWSSLEQPKKFELKTFSSSFWSFMGSYIGQPLTSISRTVRNNMAGYFFAMQNPEEDIYIINIMFAEIFSRDVFYSDKITIKKWSAPSVFESLFSKNYLDVVNDRKRIFTQMAEFGYLHKIDVQATINGVQKPIPAVVNVKEIIPQTEEPDSLIDNSKFLNFHMDPSFIQTAIKDYPSTYNKITATMLDDYNRNRTKFIEDYAAGKYKDSAGANKK